MRIKVNKDTVTILNAPTLNKGEYGVHKCEFEFSKDYDDLIKMAVFKYDHVLYKLDIINNVCDIPSEVLEREGKIYIGVYGYIIVDGELVLRYSPTPDTIPVESGSYTSGGKTPVPVTPTQYEMYSQALNEGLEIAKESSDYTRAVGDQLLEDKANGVFKGEKGDKGDAGAVKLVVVNELPNENIENDAIYLVPSNDPSLENVYDEYVYTNGTWEKLSGGGATVEVDLTDYYTKEETNNAIDNKIASIPKVDLSNYYNKQDAETMVDNKIAEIPTNDLLHYKGHVSSVDNLPRGAQPNAPTIAPLLSVGALNSTNTLSSTGVNNFNEVRGSYTYMITTGYTGKSSTAFQRARIKFNSRSVLDGCCPLSTTSLALHFNASTSTPVYVYGTSDITTIYYDDGTTQATTTTDTAITKPFWTQLTLNNYQGSYVINTATNINFDIKLKFPPVSTGLVTQEYKTFRATTNGRRYAEGYYLLTPIGLTADTTGWFTYCDGNPSENAIKNNFYTVGTNYDMYVCNSSRAWECWSKNVDTSNYYTKEEIDNLISSLSSN